MRRTGRFFPLRGHELIEAFKKGDLFSELGEAGKRPAWKQTNLSRLL